MQIQNQEIQRDGKWWHEVASGLGYDDFEVGTIVQILTEPEDEDDLAQWAEIFTEAVLQVCKNELGREVLAFYHTEHDSAYAVFDYSLIAIDKATLKCLTVADAECRPPEKTESVYRFDLHIDVAAIRTLDDVNRALESVIGHIKAVLESSWL